MLRRIGIGGMGVTLGIAYWPAEAAIHAWLFSEGSFFDNLIHADANELWMRTLISLGFVCFGLYAQHAMNQHRQMYMRLRKQDERLKRIIDTAHDAYISIDETGVITGWNIQAEKIFGWQRPAVMGQPLEKVIIPERLREAHRRGMKRYMETNIGPWLYKPVRTTALHKDGHEFPVELVIVPLRSEGGQEFFAFLRKVNS
ncbi:MAG: PAS domain-containing protein [Mariprofundaceae bacterium]